ncbi:MAG TPA: hybrid sensor histidine kinase/response regulator [Vicinamibacterales bacterium]|nr:hybrid sensor histidine kinase/response regulator [Vicinamibacterales bacterium]
MPGPLSLRTHLVLLILGAVLPGALLTSIIVRRTLDENRSVLEHRLEDTARVDAAALDREFNGTIRVLRTLAESPALDAGSLEAFWSEARRAVSTQEGWAAVILLTPDGQQRLNTLAPFGEPLTYAEEPDSLTQAVATRQPVVGHLFRVDRDDTLRFPIRVPVERQGELRYVLTALMEPESLASVIRTHLPETEEWTRAIVDSGLLIAARSRGGDQWIGRPVTAAGREIVLNPPDRPIQGTSLEGEELYSSLARGAYGWTTAVAVPRAILDGPVRASIVATVSGGAVLILGGLLSVLLVSRRLSRDFESARDAAAALAEGLPPAPARPGVAEAKEVHASLERAAKLLHDREGERDEQLLRAVKAQAQAEEANRAKDSFLAVLGHELRNPLAPALTALELMKARGGTTLLRERQVLERQISYMTRLVDDLLDVSRLTRGKITLVRQRFELRNTVDRALDMARPLIEQHGHVLSVAVPEAGLSIDGDPDRIVQVIVNLLTNAAKYTPPGGRVTLTSAVVGGSAEIACEDNGPGVPAEMVPLIFEPFTQGPRSIDRQQGGLGLGLTLARSLTELHGGSLRYEAVHPHGSRFIVTLPIASADAAESAGAENTETTVTPRRVLLVDDNVDGLEMMRVALESWGHDVQSATDGGAAIALAAVTQPDVAVLDIGLPDMNGYDLARALRAAQPHMRLIALTGYGQEADAEAAREAGFDAHCTKPVTIAVLLNQIASPHGSAAAGP